MSVNLHRCCIARSFLTRSALYGLLLSMFGFVNAGLCAQEIKIKLVDGRNGHPLGNTCMDVYVGKEQVDPVRIPTDSNGIATFHLTADSSEVDISHQGSECGPYGAIDPVFQYSNEIRVHVGYVLCQAKEKDYSWLWIYHYATKDLTQSGIVAPNTCGKATEERKPGELVIFVRPLTWWEKWKQ